MMPDGFHQNSNFLEIILRKASARTHNPFGITKSDLDPKRRIKGNTFITACDIDVVMIHIRSIKIAVLRFVNFIKIFSI